MGTEKGLTIRLKALAAGNRGEPLTPEGGGSPNHVALRHAAAYGYDPVRYSGRLVAFFDSMWSDGHCSHGDADEAFTSSHFAWWANAMAAAWFFAVEHRDSVAISRCRRWWRAELAAWSLCATPTGRVVIPGARCHIADAASKQTTMADQTSQRDTAYRLLTGRKFRLPRNAGKSLDWAFLDLQSKLPASEIAAVSDAGPRDLPRLRSKMVVERSAAGHVASFPDGMMALRPAFWAWVDHRTGEERWGCVKSWPKGYFHPDGIPSEVLPIPECPAAGEAARYILEAAAPSLTPTRRRRPVSGTSDPRGGAA